ncbi:NAD-dependent epimerase/dehydratase family protein [Nocardiopsis dassonvillei]|uniref:NAD-dependent epimerase/dehydratase family protein n=1 Tax=Nocardiopsis dassonvillei TaxID=2014 RepID=UPI0036392C9C
MNTPSVAVLGGTGWVGRHVCEVFTRKGYDVMAVARKPAPHLVGCDFQPLDIAAASPETIAGLLRLGSVNVVINAVDAANATDGWSRSEAQLLLTNVDMVERLLEAITMLPQRPRLVHLGTIFEYGPVPEGTLLDENAPSDPVSTYARTKLAGSRAVLDRVGAGELSAMVLRLVNVCGPHPSPASFPGKLMNTVRTAVREGGPVEVRIADAHRDYVDVRDVAMACWAAAESGVDDRVVNIGSGIAVRIRDLVERFVSIAGLPLTAIEEIIEPVSSFGPDWVRTDIRLADDLLRWRPEITLTQSLRAMWESAAPTY